MLSSAELRHIFLTTHHTPIIIIAVVQSSAVESACSVVSGENEDVPHDVPSYNY